MKLFNFLNNTNSFYYYYHILFPLFQYLHEIIYFHGFVNKHTICTTIIVSVLLNVTVLLEAELKLW